MASQILVSTEEFIELVDLEGFNLTYLATEQDTQKKVERDEVGVALTAMRLIECPLNAFPQRFPQQCEKLPRLKVKL
jgi:hypothetical protein